MENLVNNNQNELDKHLKKYLLSLQAFLQPHKERQELGKMADKLGFHQSRLSQFLSGERFPTEYYITKFIERRVMKVEQFLQGRALSELSEEEQRFWKKMKVLELPELVETLVELMEKGVDVVSLNKSALPQK